MSHTNLPNPKRNFYVVAIALFALASAILSFYYNLKFLGITSIVIIDIFLFILLFEAAKASRPSSTYISWTFPTREVGIILFFVFFISLSIAFAALYLELANNSLDAFCFSIGTMTTVSIVNLVVTDAITKWTIIAQLGSTILLFFAAFPLLLSRLSTFKG